ncbi:Uncharacterised protein [Helicobacter cinaedi]|uniref:Uncharacterized protein n=1 Tax=Helicobacter cinaedi TaxID=213 RepID=A0A377JX73_9HELI|nr:hypothetical protein [Helicobacter cinaedi]STP14309.1 Uncharacterised protein [Helicobacter cinaedi]
MNSLIRIFHHRLKKHKAQAQSLQVKKLKLQVQLLRLLILRTLRVKIQKSVCKKKLPNHLKKIKRESLVEALSTPLNTSSTSTATKIAESKDSSLDSKATTPRLASMPMPQTKIPQEEAQSSKTLADVQISPKPKA